MQTRNEKEIHCHACGGFIGDSRTVSYMAQGERAQVMAPRSGLCGCGSPTVYGPPPGNSSTPGIPGMGHGRRE